MSDFAQATKYLDITPTTRDLTVNTKPLSLEKARGIRKVFKKFTLESYTESTFLHVNARLAWQYNVTMPEAFRITNWGDLRGWLSYFNFGTIAIRYRVGTDVTRYILYQQDAVPFTLNIPWYSGELIEPNCVVEVWDANLSVGGLIGLYRDTTFITNLAENPEDADDTGTVYEATAREQSALFHTQPETIPTAYGEESAWIDNA